MAVVTDDGNGRVTMARLEERIVAQGNLISQRFDALEDRLDDFCRAADDREHRIRTLEGKQGWAVWRDIGAALAGGLTGILAALSGKP